MLGRPPRDRGEEQIKLLQHASQALPCLLTQQPLLGFGIRNCARREPLCQAPQTCTRVRSQLLLQSILTSDPPANVIAKALDSVAVSVHFCTLRLLIPVEGPEYLP